MYEFVDRPVTQLNPTGKLLLLAMRLWARQAASGKCGCVRLQALFAAHGYSDSLGPFRLLMGSLQGGARRNVSFRHPECPDIGEDEAILLALIRRPDHAPANRFDAARTFVVGARLPHFMAGLDRLDSSFQGRGGPPRIAAVALPNRLSGPER